MGNWKVYCHTNIINNKKYIGITSKKDPNDRWENGNGYKNNPYFTNAIKKNGWENFTHEILFNNLTKEEACVKEIELIEYYKTTQRKYGYNISKGGTAPMAGRKHTKITKKKMSENNGKYWEGKHHSEESKQKISESKKGTLPWNKNKEHSDETKQKISKKTKERLKDKRNNPMYGVLGDDNPNSKKIYCIELDKIFIGIRNASREMNIPLPNIIRSLKSNGYYSAGKQGNTKLHWIYMEE